MLDAFKKNGTARQQQADELQALIAASKEERAALSTMLTQLQMHSAKLATAELGAIEARKQDQAALDELRSASSQLATLREMSKIALDTVNRLTERTQEAQTMLRSLQAERETTERNIKQPRKRAPAEAKAKLA